MSAPLRIGVSACLFHADRERPVFNGKPLYYLEQSMARFVGSQGALVYLIPGPGDAQGAESYAADLDGLVLAGGVDVSPGSYGETPIKPEWAGDAVRDAYELALTRAFLAADKPILGICRGHQLLNVALGGSLYQDILHQVDGALVHRDKDVYDRNAHTIVFQEGTDWVGRLTPAARAKVNSVHHQAIKGLGDGLVVDARSEEDGVIEAVTRPGAVFVRGVQWHPEFTDPTDQTYLDNGPLLAAFQASALARRSST